MRAVVIYKSNTGFTKKYAEWIAEELQGKAISFEEARRLDLSSYNALIFGSHLFVGSVKGLKEFKEKLLTFKGKKSVFVVGAMPTEAPQVREALTAYFGKEEFKDTKICYLRGGLDYAKMGFISKLMMKGLNSAIKKQKGVDSEEYKAISCSYDATDRASIQELVSYMREEKT